MPPVNILIKPASGLCNMRCKYCFYSDVLQNREKPESVIMSEQNLEILVKRAFAYAEGYAGFAFQGGEPTLAGLEFYRKLIEFQNKYNTKNIPVHNSIQTNGYIIDEHWAKFFQKHHFLVGLSLDGYSEMHDALRIDAEGNGTCSRVIKAAKLFFDYKVECNILCVVNNFVARYPKKVYNSLKKYKYVQFIPCLDDFSGEKESFSLSAGRYTKFLNETFDLYYQDFINGTYVSIRNFDNYVNMLTGKPPENCSMNGICTCYFVVDGDGSVYPCDFYVLDKWKLGTVADNSFFEMINGNLAKEFVEISKQVDPKCKECKHYFLCRGGCRREREPEIQGKLSLNRMCESYLSFFEKNKYKFENILTKLR